MANEFKGHTAHSAEHFGDSRDYWWNRDFLQLMARRWRLDSVRDVLDVGCGVGHWGMLLASVLPASARFTGVDREPIWVEQAAARALARGIAERCSYRVGEAEQLPFADDSLDLTTCQTLLVHLPDPVAAIAEMLRVTKPGGLVAVAEPNNLTESLLLDSLSNQASINEIVELVRFQLTCERGKVALGEGDSFTEDARDRVARRLWNWSEAESRRFFLAGGGPEADLAGHFARGLAARERIVRGLDERTYHGIVGGEFYLVAGRKNPNRA